MSFRVVVDSGSDLRQGVRVVPLTLQVGPSSFIDNEALDLDDLLWSMGECPEAPRSACPGPGAYLDAFGDGEDDVYVFTLSALLSGSYNAARQGAEIWREEHPQGNIHVFNTCSAAAGESLIALRATELASDERLTFQEVVAQLNQYIVDTNTLFVLESLETLRKAGRLGRIQGFLAGAARLKLVLGSTPEGEIKKVSQALSMTQGVGKLAAAAAADPAHVGRRCMISYCGNLERAFQLRRALEEKCRFGEILMLPTRGVSTVYAGNGGIVMAY